MTAVGKNIRSFRGEAGLSQTALGELLHVTPQTVSSWETGRTRPDVDTLENISASLGVGLTELIYGRRPAEEKPFVKFEKKHIVWTAALASLAAIALIISLPWFGGLLTRLLWRDSAALSGAKYAWGMLTPYVLRPIMYASLGALVPAAILLVKDIRVKNKAACAALVMTALIFAFIYALSAASMMAPHVSAIGANLANMIAGWAPTFLLVGPMAFLGLNR